MRITFSRGHDHSYHDVSEYFWMVKGISEFSCVHCINRLLVKQSLLVFPVLNFQVEFRAGDGLRSVASNRESLAVVCLTFVGQAYLPDRERACVVPFKIKIDFSDWTNS